MSLGRCNSPTAATSSLPPPKRCGVYSSITPAANRPASAAALRAPLGWTWNALPIRPRRSIRGLTSIWHSRSLTRSMPPRPSWRSSASLAGCRSRRQLGEPSHASRPETGS
jgi:hypothetical protein